MVSLEDMLEGNVLEEKKTTLRVLIPLEANANPLSVFTSMTLKLLVDAASSPVMNDGRKSMIEYFSDDPLDGCTLNTGTHQNRGDENTSPDTRGAPVYEALATWAIVVPLLLK